MGTASARGGDGGTPENLLAMPVFGLRTIVDSPLSRIKNVK